MPRLFQERAINYAAPIATSHLPRENFGTWEFPVLHVRGGTSTGLIIWDRVAPKALELREELLRHLMGLPLQGSTSDTKQITGLGRGYPTSNKVFFAEMTTNAAGSPQIVSTLAQLAGGKSQIDWSVNCGNMSAALPYWAIDQHFLPRQFNGKGEVEIFNTNTKSTMIGRVTLAGDGFAMAQIPGVDGEFPGVDLFMANPVGAKTGKALPTGSAADQFGKLHGVLRRRRGADGDRAGVGIRQDRHRAGQGFAQRRSLLFGAEEALDRGRPEDGPEGKGGKPMTADELANSETIPKVCIVGPPVNGGNISTRYFTPQEGHATMAVTGGCCLAAACLMPGTVAHEIARNLPALGAAPTEIQVDIENPAGILSATIEGQQTNQETKISPRRLQALGANSAARICADYRASAALNRRSPKSHPAAPR